MSRSLVRLSCLAALALFAVAGFLPAEERTSNQPASRRRAAASVPGEREIRNALQASTESARWKLLNRLQRAGDAADRPETVAAIAEGLQSRFARQAADAIDLQMVSLLSGFTSEDAVLALRSFLHEKDWKVAFVSLKGLLNSKWVGHWDAVELLAERPEYLKVYALRRAVVAYAEENASPAALDFLISTVSKSEGQLKYEAAVALTKLTGEPFGGRGEDWQAWREKSRDGFVPVSPDQRRPVSLANKDLVWPEPAPEFFSLPIYARRVVFILDRSKSMESSVNGLTRIDRARMELETAITGLPAETEFNVLAYHEDVDKFVSHLAPANPDRKRDAILFAETFIPERKTACYDALVAGLEVDPNLEAIYFLSDGEPTAGQIVDPPVIVAAITQRNQLQMTSIYTLGIDARGLHEEFLRDLAASNFGQFFLIR